MIVKSLKIKIDVFACIKFYLTFDIDLIIDISVITNQAKSH